MLQINITSDFMSKTVWEWNPQPDITTFELAQCLPIILRPYSMESYAITIPENIIRHFRSVEL